METGFLQGNGIEALPQFLTSLAIGLLIGLERERTPSAKAGLRTFALVALFGTLTGMLAIGVTALLYFKPELRGISQRLTRRDLVAVLQFSVLTFIVLPILPDQDYGPYNAFNPHQAWLMVVLISGISLAGYTP